MQKLKDKGKEKYTPDLYWFDASSSLTSSPFSNREPLKCRKSSTNLKLLQVSFNTTDNHKQTENLKPNVKQHKYEI